MSNGLDPHRLARAMSIEHYRPSHRNRVNWVAVAVGLLIITAAIVVMWPEK